MRRDQQIRLNREYVRPVELGERDETTVRALLREHLEATGSETARALLVEPSAIATELCRVEPLR